MRGWWAGLARRTGVTGLTLRGRSFSLAGLACLALGLWLGDSNMLRVGILLVALPLVAMLVVIRTRYRLSCRRRVDPVRIHAGDETTVTLQLDNVGRRRCGPLLVEDTLPHRLGGRPRFPLERLAPGETGSASYTVRVAARGRYRLGPLSVRLTDPFGLCRVTRRFTTVDHLVVTPRVVGLPPVRLSTESGSGGHATSRSLRTNGEHDATPREYRHGDDLRKVHWRSTARTGDLMVRREEQSGEPRAALVLDTRANAYSGRGADSSFEDAVAAAASIGVALTRAGYALRLVDTGGQQAIGLTGLAGSAVEDALLTQLTVVAPGAERTLAGAVAGLGLSPGAGNSGGPGTVVAVVGALDAREATRLAAVPGGATSRIAVVVADEFAPGGGAGLLTAAGWRVVRLAPGSSLAQVWPQAALRPMLAVR